MEIMKDERRREYDRMYQETMSRRFQICISRKFKPDIVAHVEHLRGRKDYICRLIREDMKRRGAI